MSKIKDSLFERPINEKNLIIRKANLNDFDNFYLFYKNNLERFKPIMPSINTWLSLENARAKFKELLSQCNQKELCWLLIYSCDGSSLIGEVKLDGYIGGPLEACYMSYKIDSLYEGKGIMKASITRIIDEVYSNSTIYRIMANYIPSNERSANLLKSIGFCAEGLARNYLMLDGQRKDHILTSMMRENWNFHGKV